ncbi:hypothetical protein MT325_m724R [Paramecium bursaria chlorella virus MT325]|uniref:Uncharacterized protein m724R n=1 Tax=Paramecium bursaria Chlorella virus MT325 TaxID=346932 RepID=A7IVA4_PBCVM|nr:hypothetical protein MT325_m724R [Paramecium bursaria chlorella virus MT325]
MTLLQRKKQITADLPHWNSCFAASSRLRGPSPKAIAFPAYTPRLPLLTIIIVVVISSSSSGPIPPTSFNAEVRTA